MSTASESSLVPTRTHWKTRVFSLVSLILILGATIHGGQIAYRAMTDAWVAPIRLSPDNDRIIALRVERVRQQTERGRLESDLAGIDEELKALDLAMERLSTLNAGFRGARTWTLRVQQQERRAIVAEYETIEQQRAMLENLRRVHLQLVDRARSELSSGIITTTQYEKEALDLSQIDVALKANERELIKIRAARKLAENRGAGPIEMGLKLTDLANQGTAVRSPEVLKFDEQQVRIELEIAKMQAERRAAEAKRRNNVTTLESIKNIEDDLRRRPLYRAMTERTDLAFVPYSQMSELSNGDNVFRCIWGVIFCKHVGSVKEIVPGEVVTQDPWGDTARGQYVVLDVRDNSALNEKVLRVRRRSTKSELGERLSVH
jgi:hypothetical protein